MKVHRLQGKHPHSVPFMGSRPLKIDLSDSRDSSIDLQFDPLVYPSFNHCQVGRYGYFFLLLGCSYSPLLVHSIFGSPSSR